jgi:hypothetical protein
MILLMAFKIFVELLAIEIQQVLGFNIQIHENIRMY